MDEAIQRLTSEIQEALAKRPLQLPLWRDQQRVMPKEFIAASVFSAMQSQDTPYAKKLTLIGEWNGYQLRYKGRRLTQVHADVWQGVMEIAGWHAAEGSTVEFRSRQLLKLIGRGTDRVTRKQLHEWITDMAACLVEITMPGGRAGFFASVFPECAWKKNEATGQMHYSVKLNRALCEVFGRGYSAIDWDQRKLLRRNELALWLQQYVAAFPMPVALDHLRLLSGDRTERLRDFRRKVRFSMRALQTVGVVHRWQIDSTDRLMVALPEQLTA
jgi:hypothetical protein